MSRLLVTSFQKPGYNLREAQLFKIGALDSKLVTHDRANEIALPAEFVDRPGQSKRGIRVVGSSDADRLFSFMSLSSGGGTGWSRLNALPGKAFETWLASLYAQPLDCWLIGGHHHGNSNFDAMIWGTELDGGSEYLPYTGFGLTDTLLEFEWFGYRGSPNAPRRVVIPGAAAALKPVCLLAVLGCNGIPRLGANAPLMAQAWRQVTKPALIIGWYNTHRMPLDTENRHATDKFWDRLKVLKQDSGIADGGVQQLVKDAPEAVIEAWGQSCYSAFHNSKVQPKLWRVPGWGKGAKAKPGYGAGAVHPDGRVFHANPKYVGAPGTDAMVFSGITLR